MSRTYRTHMEYYQRAYGRLWTMHDKAVAGFGTRYIAVPDGTVNELVPGASNLRVITLTYGWNGCERVTTRCRDKKPWDKPDKEFKQMNRRIERARANQAVRLGKDVPVVKRSDCYDWT